MRLLDPEDYLTSDDEPAPQPRQAPLDASKARAGRAGSRRAVAVVTAPERGVSAPPSNSNKTPAPASRAASPASLNSPFPADQFDDAAQTPTDERGGRRRGPRMDKVFSEFYRYCKVLSGERYFCAFCNHAFGVMRDQDGAMKPTSKIVRHFKDHHHKILDELFIPFASIDPYVPIARRVPFMIEISGRNPNNTTHIILHPTYTIFGVQTFIVPGNGQQTQLMLSGQVAVPRTCKPLAWPLVTFKNLVRTPAKDIRGYHVYSFIRSIGSSPANDKIKSKITTTPAGKGLASGAEAETVPSLPQPEEDPIWSSVVVPNNKGPSSPWYAHCRQRKSDRVIFCAYCNHSYGLRAAWGSSDKKRKKKKGEDGGEGDADMKDGDDDEDEEMGDASDGENGEGSKEPPTPDSANPDSAKVKRSRDPNKVRNYLVKGGMTSNIKRHVLSLHSEELEADTWTGSFPPVDPADATLFAEFVKEAPPPWLADAKVAGDAVSAFLVHPTLSLLEFKATAAKDSFHLTGSFGAISRDRSTYDLLARYDNLEPRSQELNKVVTVHRFERVMEQKGLVAVSVVQMPTPPYERVIYVRHLRREDKKVEQAVPMDV